MQCNKRQMPSTQPREDINYAYAMDNMTEDFGEWCFKHLSEFFPPGGDSSDCIDIMFSQTTQYLKQGLITLDSLYL